MQLTSKQTIEKEKEENRPHDHAWALSKDEADLEAAPGNFTGGSHGFTEVDKFTWEVNTKYKHPQEPESLADTPI